MLLTSSSPILLLDDSQADRELMRQAIEPAAPARPLLDFGDPDSAIAWLRRQPDAWKGTLLVDWRLDARCGIEVIAEVRAMRLAGAEIIVVTGSGSEADRAMAIAAGADAWLAKPGDWDGYEELARGIVNGRRTATAAVAGAAGRTMARSAERLTESLRGHAHDLRNQLTTVLGYCDLLARDDSQASALACGVLLDPGFAAGHAIKAAGYVGRIRGAARRCSEIASAMMTFRAGGDEPQQWPLADLNALLLDEVGSLNSELLRAGINTHVERGRDVPPVRIDALSFGRVICNLSLNARDAILSAPGQRTSEPRIVFATSRAAADEALLVVADDGPGMTPEVQDRVWEAGYSTKPAGQGRRGFGLAVVRNCIEDARGRVELESAPGRGTMFRIYLPAA